MQAKSSVCDCERMIIGAPHRSTGVGGIASLVQAGKECTDAVDLESSFVARLTDSSSGRSELERCGRSIVRIACHSLLHLAAIK
jgi:hypothetical protein